MNYPPHVSCILTPCQKASVFLCFKKMLPKIEACYGVPCLLVHKP
jgi:hypothetical protein